ncbi:hypothetical protein AAC387_Pa02g3240 [Persea americana]
MAEESWLLMSGGRLEGICQESTWWREPRRWSSGKFRGGGTENVSFILSRVESEDEVPFDGEGELVGVLEVDWAGVGRNGGEMRLDDGWGKVGRDEIVRLKVGWEEGENGVVAGIAGGVAGCCNLSEKV